MRNIVGRQKTRALSCKLLAATTMTVAILTCLAANAVAQAVVAGTGNPDVDVPAVQAAVDKGGEVILKGYFSFNRPPTIHTDQLSDPAVPPATVLVSKAVTISGAQKYGERATIEGGSIPFFVEAPGASVTIQGLRFIRPTGTAILVYAAHGLMIANCKFESAVPVFGFEGGAISVMTSTFPSLVQPGHPENIFGRLLITNNEIDLGGSATDNTIGILMFSVGRSPDTEADIYISGNRIRNTTEPAINFRRIGGRAHVEGNVINTGPISSQVAPRPEAIRIANTGSYVIAHNSIHCEWPDPQAKGIGVFSQIAAWPVDHAVVMDNSVKMSPPPGIAFSAFSAGIEIRGFALDNIVANNKIRGRAKAALSVDPFNGGTPSNNTFIHNRLDDFEASSADTFIGQGVTGTLLLGQQGTVEDHGVNTVVVPLREDDGSEDENGIGNRGR